MKSLRNSKKNIKKYKVILQKIRKHEYLTTFKEIYNHKCKERAIKSQVGDVVITMEGELSCG